MQIDWLTHLEIDKARELSDKEGKPILLNIFSPSCPGSMRLEREVLSDERVIREVMAKTIPVRCVTESETYDLEKAQIIGKHIFIWSPSLQMTNSKGVFFHEFPTAPRYTRLDAFYNRVHHDLPGSITTTEMLNALSIGYEKHRVLEHHDYDGAAQSLRSSASDMRHDTLAQKEVDYWLGIARNRGYSSEPGRLVSESMSPLGRAVAAVAEELIALSEEGILRDWKGKSGPNSWRYYTDNVREVVYGLWQSLIDFSRNIALNRSEKISEAQLILAQHHRAFRDLTALVAGFGDDILDAQPLPKERSLRNHYVHVALAEWWAHTPHIRFARELKQHNESPRALESQAVLESLGFPPVCFGSLAELLDKYEEVHWKVVNEFSSMTTEELDAESVWWEGSPVAVRFRLNRLGWHLRDHSTIVENVLQALGKQVTEQQRFARQLFSALGEVEAALIGVSDNQFSKEYIALTSFVEQRARELRNHRRP